MRSYEQYCPLARALDMVGDRWAMLVLRELFFAPKRFTDLQTRLDGIAPNLLSRRLKELEARGLVARRPSDDGRTSLYEVTDVARGLEKAMLELAKWGIQFLGSFEGDEPFAIEWLIPVLEEMADRAAAAGVHDVYEFRLGGSAFWVHVDDGDVRVRPGHAPGTVDLLVETDVDTFLSIGFGALTPEDAIASGRARAAGDLTLAERALDILAPARTFSRLLSLIHI